MPSVKRASASLLRRHKELPLTRLCLQSPLVSRASRLQIGRQELVTLPSNSEAASAASASAMRERKAVSKGFKSHVESRRLARPETFVRSTLHQWPATFFIRTIVILTSAAFATCTGQNNRRIRIRKLLGNSLTHLLGYSATQLLLYLRTRQAD